MAEDERDPLFEYSQCTEFYNARNTLTGELFVRMIQTFSTLIVVLGALTVLEDRISQWLRVLATSVVGIVGFIAFLAILLDLAGTASVKEAVRTHVHDLEEASPGLPQLWSMIQNREMFAEERMLKKAIPTRPLRERELEGNLYVTAARVALCLWPVVVVAALIDV